MVLENMAAVVVRRRGANVQVPGDSRTSAGEQKAPSLVFYTWLFGLSMSHILMLLANDNAATVPISPEVEKPPSGTVPGNGSRRSRVQDVGQRGVYERLIWTCVSESCLCVRVRERGSHKQMGV